MILLRLKFLFSQSQNIVSAETEKYAMNSIAAKNKSWLCQEKIKSYFLLVVKFKCKCYKITIFQYKFT